MYYRSFPPVSIFDIFLSSNFRDRGWTRTLNLGILREVFYHYATAGIKQGRYLFAIFSLPVRAVAVR